MSATKKKSSAWSVIAFLLVLLLIAGIVSSVYLLFFRQSEYIAQADEYVDLQRFSYWADEDGEKVSEENPYIYTARSEQELTAVYEDFIDFDIIYSDGTASDYTHTVYNSGEKTLENCFWFNTCVLTTPLTYGMTVEFSVQEGMYQALFGLSEASVVADTAAHAWNENFPYLFIPTYNYYSGMEGSAREEFGYLYPASGSVGGKMYFDTTTWSLPFEEGSEEEVRVRLVLDDTLLLYLNDELVISEAAGADYSLDKDTEYYFSFAACNTDMRITDFGYDEYIVNRGTLGEEDLSSSPLSAEEFSGKKISFLGDSITAGVGVSSTEYRYSTVLSDSLGMTESNLGISSTVYCTGHPSRASRIEDVQNIPTDSDYVIVLLGINDFDQAIAGQFAELGEFGNADTSTIYGAANAMYRALVDRFRCTEAKIYICTPVITSWNNSVSAERDWSQDKQNACGYTLPDLCGALQETAQYYGLVCCDLNATSGMTEEDFADGIHPNDTGAAKMAGVLEEFLLENYYYEF